jgi:predicted nuclease of predicted toxin-antitoxin system
MKLLLDQNLSFKICPQIQDLFPGSSQVRLLGLSRADDRTIWEYAREHGFAIVSQDADFAEMAVLLGSPPRVIWLRTGNCRTEMLVALLRQRRGAILAFGDDPEAVCLELYRPD